MLVLSKSIFLTWDGGDAADAPSASSGPKRPVEPEPACGPEPGPKRRRAIEALVGMNFPAAAARGALEATGGDVDAAALLLAA